MKKFNKVLAVLLSLVMLFSVIPVSAFAAETPTSGNQTAPGGSPSGAPGNSGTSGTGGNLSVDLTVPDPTGTGKDGTVTLTLNASQLVAAIKDVRGVEALVELLKDMVSTSTSDIVSMDEILEVVPVENLMVLLLGENNENASALIEQFGGFDALMEMIDLNGLIATANLSGLADFVLALENAATLVYAQNALKVLEELGVELNWEAAYGYADMDKLTARLKQLSSKEDFDTLLSFFGGDLKNLQDVILMADLAEYLVDQDIITDKVDIDKIVNDKTLRSLIAEKVKAKYDTLLTEAGIAELRELLKEDLLKNPPELTTDDFKPDVIAGLKEEFRKNPPELTTDDFKPEVIEGLKEEFRKNPPELSDTDFEPAVIEALKDEIITDIENELQRQYTHTQLVEKGYVTVTGEINTDQILHDYQGEIETRIKNKLGEYVEEDVQAILRGEEPKYLTADGAEKVETAVNEFIENKLTAYIEEDVQAILRGEEPQYLTADGAAKVEKAVNEFIENKLTAYIEEDAQIILQGGIPKYLTADGAEKVEDAITQAIENADLDKVMKVMQDPNNYDKEGVQKEVLNVFKENSKIDPFEYLVDDYDPFTDGDIKTAVFKFVNWDAFKSSDKINRTALLQWLMGDGGSLADIMKDENALKEYVEKYIDLKPVFDQIANNKVKLDTIVNMDALIETIKSLPGEDIATLFGLLNRTTLAEQLIPHLRTLAGKLTKEQLKAIFTTTLTSVLGSVNYISVNGYKVMEASVTNGGFPTVNYTALANAVFSILPTLDDLAVTDGTLLAFNLYIDYNVKLENAEFETRTKDVNLKVVLDGNVEQLNKLAARLAQYISVTRDGNRFHLELTVPSAVAAAYAKLLNSDRGEAIKKELVALLGKDVSDWVEVFDQLTLEQIVRVLSKVSPEEVYSALANLSYAELLLNKLSDMTGGKYNLDSLKDLNNVMHMLASEKATLEYVCGLAEKLVHADVMALLEKVAAAADDVATVQKYLDKLATLPYFGKLIEGMTPSAILEKYKNVNPMMAVANIISEKTGTDFAQMLATGDADAVWQAALTRASDYEGYFKRIQGAIVNAMNPDYVPTSDLAKAIYNLIPRDLLKKALASSLTDLYRGNGVFSAAAESISVDLGAISKRLVGLLYKGIPSAKEYADIIDRFLPDGTVEFGVSAKVNFTNLCKVTYKDVTGKTVLVTTFLPYGANPAGLVTPPDMGSRAFLYWADENGNEVTKITGDMTLTAHYENTVVYHINFSVLDASGKKVKVGSVDILSDHAADGITAEAFREILAKLNFTDYGYKFPVEAYDLIWKDADGNEINPTEMEVTGNAEVTGEYVIRTFSVKVTEKDGETLYEGTAAYGSTLAEILAANKPGEKDGYHIVWCVLGENGEWSEIDPDLTKSSVTAAVNYRYEYVINRFTVTVTGSDGTQTFDNVAYGTTLEEILAQTMPETPEGHYTVWYVLGENGEWSKIDPNLAKVSVNAPATYRYEHIINLFTVTVTDHNGKIHVLEKIPYGTRLTAENLKEVMVAFADCNLSLPEEAYNLVWYFGGKTISEEEILNTPINEDTEFAWQYEVKTYTLTIIGEDGSTVEKTVTWGTKLTVEDLPLREGDVFSDTYKRYTLVGEDGYYAAQWLVNDSKKTTENVLALEIKEDTRIELSAYEVFLHFTYTVTFVDEKGTVLGTVIVKHQNAKNSTIMVNPVTGELAEPGATDSKPESALVKINITQMNEIKDKVGSAISFGHFNGQYTLKWRRSDIADWTGTTTTISYSNTYTQDVVYTSFYEANSASMIFTDSQGNDSDITVTYDSKTGFTVGTAKREDGSFAVRINLENMEKLLKNLKQDSANVILEDTDSNSSFRAEISSDVISQLIEKGTVVVFTHKVETKNVSHTFRTEGGVEFTYGKENHTVYTFDLTVDGEKFADPFKGDFIITVPYAEKIALDSTLQRTAVYVATESGMEYIGNAEDAGTDFVVSFNARHFSDYVLVNEYKITSDMRDEGGKTVKGTLNIHDQYIPEGAIVAPVVITLPEDMVYGYYISSITGTYRVKGVEQTIPIQTNGGSFTMPGSPVTFKSVIKKIGYIKKYMVGKTVFDEKPEDAYVEKANIVPLGYTLEKDADGKIVWIGSNNNGDAYLTPAMKLIEYTVTFAGAGSMTFTVLNFAENFYVPAVPLPLDDNKQTYTGMTGAWDHLITDMEALIGAMDSNNTLTFTPVYQPRIYQIILPDGSTAECKFNETYTPVIGTRTGYTVGKVICTNLSTSAEVSMTDGSFIMPASNVVITVEWIPNTLHFTVLNSVTGTKTNLEAAFGSYATYTVKVPKNAVLENAPFGTLVSFTVNEDGSKTLVYSFLVTEEITDNTEIAYRFAEKIPATVSMANGKITTDGAPASDIKNLTFDHFASPENARFDTNIYQFATYTQPDTSGSLLWLWILLAVVVLIALIALFYTLYIKGHLKPNFILRFITWLVSIFFAFCLAVSAVILWLLQGTRKREKIAFEEYGLAKPDDLDENGDPMEEELPVQTDETVNADQTDDQSGDQSAEQSDSEE